ncbi:hypothetical protein [Fuchsiella alkaliacetigena]|uniref:hypothetical protein n=1 Tax=Fuchsiella alkaliacetigena TaxID=957042 RepID=UPI00200A6C81|nr:hypothetical protein [Fuchsiella alkaliacetigena]MCK8824732.1 hypothetical protein [Fuchsiella alkaliacetigena]
MNEVLNDFKEQVTDNFTIKYTNKTKEEYFVPGDYPALCVDPENFDPETKGLSRKFAYNNFAFNLVYYEPIPANDNVDMSSFIDKIEDIMKELVTSSELNKKYLFGASVSLPKKRRHDNEEFKAVIKIKGEVI